MVDTQLDMDNHHDGSPGNAKDKSLPPLPTSLNDFTLEIGDNLLGLGFAPATPTRKATTADSAGGLSLVQASMSPTKPSPSYFIPLTTPPSPPVTPLKLGAPSTSAIAPPQQVASTSKRDREKKHPFQSSSTVNLASSETGSTSTIRLAAGLALEIPEVVEDKVDLMTPRSNRTFGPSSPSSPSTPTSRPQWSWRKNSAQSLQPALRDTPTPSPSPGLNKKRSSGQLLVGLGKGLGRVSSVMRRNTSEASTPQSEKSSVGRSMSRSGKGPFKRKQSQAESPPEAKIRDTGTHLQEDQGDEGIGLPFNVAHDLHVSPSLEDLPPSWLNQLREQGVSEQDLLLIAAARRKQAAVAREAIFSNGSDASRSMQSLPRSVGQSSRGVVTGMSPYGVLSTSNTSLSGYAASEERLNWVLSLSTADTGMLKRKPSTGGLLRKFSFEPPSPTQQPTRLAAVGRDTDEGGATTSDEVIPVNRDETEDEQEASMPELKEPKDTRRAIPRRAHRFSDQIKVFSQFDLGGDEGWAASLLNAMQVKDAVPTKTTAEEMAPTKTYHESMSVPVEAARKASDTLPQEKDESPTASEKQRAIKRVPIPPLLPTPVKQSSSKNILSIPQHELFESRGGRSVNNFSRSSPSSSSENESTAAPPLAEAPVDRRPSADEPVYRRYAASKSSVEQDLITPSTSNSPHSPHSPHSHYHPYQSTVENYNNDTGTTSDEEVDNASGSELDFANALMDGRYTPASTASDVLKAYSQTIVPPVPIRSMSLDHLKFKSNTSRPSDGYDMGPGASVHRELQTINNPHHSLPASVPSSFRSRSPSLMSHKPMSDLDHFVLAGHHSVGFVPSSSDMRGSHDPINLTPDTRRSLAQSVLSLESGYSTSLHDATVKVAYHQLKGDMWGTHQTSEAKVQQVVSGRDRSSRERREKRTSLRKSGRMSATSTPASPRTGNTSMRSHGEEGDGDEGSEAGFSALDALEDAARRIADGEFDEYEQLNSPVPR